VDILVHSADEVAKWQHSMNHVIARCLREGKRLYIGNPLHADPRVL